MQISSSTTTSGSVPSNGSSARPPVVNLDGLTGRFGRREILQDLRVSISGRTIGLLGSNGVGKSTLIQALIGFCPVAAGTATILGHGIHREAARVRTLVGYMIHPNVMVFQRIGPLED